jgi:hypothetical protein
VAMDQQDWVDHLELVEFCYNNSEHFAIGSTPFQKVTGKSPIVPMTWAAHGQPPSDASEEVPMVTQLDEERQRLWELVKANLEKVHKMTHSQLFKGPKCGSKWNIAEEGGVGARSLAHNTLRGRGACWSSGMGLRRVDKLHSLTRACTQPTQSA